MTEQPILTDAALEAMLARRAGPDAPAGLVTAIASGLDALPEDRRRWWSVIMPRRAQAPAIRLAWIVALVGLLLAATVSAAYVGSELLQATDELGMVPPVVTPAPSGAAAPTAETTTAPPPTLRPLVLQPVGEPTSTETAIGAITWRVYEEALPNLVVTPHGPVMVDGQELRWLGGDGSWVGTSLPRDVGRAALVGDRLVVYGEDLPSGNWVSWDGSRWVVGDALDVPPELGSITQVVAGPRGTVVIGTSRGGPGWVVATARDGEHFVAAAEPPGGDSLLGPLMATGDGFVVLVSPWEGSSSTDVPHDPVPWFSADGLSWAPVSATTPFGPGSWIRGVAGRDGRFVAVGNVGRELGSWAAWISDDGLAWERLGELGLEGAERCGTTGGEKDNCRIDVSAGDAGWVIDTWYGSASASADGRTWQAIRAWPATSGRSDWGIPVGPEVSFGIDTIVIVVTGPLDMEDWGMALGTIEP